MKNARWALVLMGVGALTTWGAPAATGTHFSDQTCFGAVGNVHGHDGDQSYNDPNGHHAVAIMAAGRDAVFADDQIDRLCGQADPDHLRGQAESDLIRAGQGADEIIAGDGDDVLNGGDGVNDYCDGGPGNDEFDGCECGPNNPC